jgi:peroxygenase
MKETAPSAPWAHGNDREEAERHKENLEERQENQNLDLKPHQQENKSSDLKTHQQENKSSALKPHQQENKSSDLKPHQQEKSSELKPKFDEKKLTVMEKHCEFFDRNKDGMIYPWETWEGFRAIGFGYILSMIGVVFIHLSFVLFANRSWIPNPRFGLDLKMMHKCKHGSDSEVYDHDGRMDKNKLDEIFKKYSDRPDSIPVRNLFWMTQEKWEGFDFFGWFAEKLEWGFLTILVKTDDWRIRREDIEAQFDGSLFYKLEQRNKAKGKGKRSAKTD